MDDPRAVIERLAVAQNAHDLEAMLACFDENYRSEQPAHPARAFQGRDQVRKNWSALLEAIPNFHVEILRSVVEGDTVWFEFHWTGTKASGQPFEEYGVGLMEVRDNRIVSGRLYGEEVEHNGADIDKTVQRMAGTDQ